MWYFLSWLSSIQLRAGKPCHTESASRNMGKMLLNATMPREGSVVCTKPARRGLEESVRHGEHFPPRFKAAEVGDAPLLEEICEPGCDALNGVPAEELREGCDGDGPHREEAEKRDDHEDLADKDRRRREIQVEPVDIARLGGCRGAQGGQRGVRSVTFSASEEEMCANPAQCGTLPPSGSAPPARQPARPRSSGR